MRIVAALVVFTFALLFYVSVENDVFQARQQNTVFTYSLRSVMLAVATVAISIAAVIKF